MAKYTPKASAAAGSLNPFLFQVAAANTSPDLSRTTAARPQGINVDLGNSKETPHTKNNQVSLNDDVFMKVSSKVEEQFRNDDEIKVSKSKPSSSIPSPTASQIPSVPSKAEVPPRHELTSSEEFMNEQQSLGAIETTIKSSQGNNGIKLSVEEGTASTCEKTITSSTHLVSEISGEEGTTSANAKTKTSTQEEGDSQRAIASTPIDITKPLTTQDVDVEIWQDNDDQVSLNDDNVMKASSNTEDQFSKDDDILVSKSRPSAIASQFPSKPSEGDRSQMDEDLSSFVVSGELESLVSKKHLTIENLSLLTDFLVKHPSVLLRDTSLSSRYKGYAYNSLAELLKFLQTHSVLDVSGSSHSEFVELLQDALRFPFHKEWLDDIEKRALLPGLQVSQDALQKLLDSKIASFGFL